jgi:hypothetical protein
MTKSGLPQDKSERACVRRDLNKMLDRLVVAHQRFNKASDPATAERTYVERWELLNELEEFFGEAVMELAPDDELPPDGGGRDEIKLAA